MWYCGRVNDQVNTPSSQEHNKAHRAVVWRMRLSWFAGAVIALVAWYAIKFARMGRVDWQLIDWTAVVIALVAGWVGTYFAARRFARRMFD